MVKTYPIVINKDSKHYWIEVPDIPGAFSEGISLIEAKASAKNNIEQILNDSKKAPNPTPLNRIKPQSGTVMLLTVDVKDNLIFED